MDPVVKDKEKQPAGLEMTKETLFAGMALAVKEGLADIAKIPSRKTALDKPADKPVDSGLDSLGKFIAAQDRGPKKGHIIEKVGDKWEFVESADLKQKTEMEQVLTGAIERPLNRLIPVAGINAGSLLVGGTLGLFLGEVIDGLVTEDLSAADPNRLFKTEFLVQAGAKLAAAAVVHQVGGSFMSRQATNAAITVLGVQALADILPLDRWIEQVVRRFRRNGTGTAAQARYSAVAQAEQVAAAAQSAAANQPFIVTEDQLQDVF